MNLTYLKTKKTSEFIRNLLFQWFLCSIGFMIFYLQNFNLEGIIGVALLYVITVCFLVHNFIKCKNQQEQIVATWHLGHIILIIVASPIISGIFYLTMKTDIQIAHSKNDYIIVGKFDDNLVCKTFTTKSKLYILSDSLVLIPLSEQGLVITKFQSDYFVLSQREIAILDWLDFYRNAPAPGGN
ncbi:MAG TPA: hypothetical protein VK154_04110 [Chitinophagales bacterium]|nr:hypothetical protein [Chitinophagales bacterium]